MNHREKLFCCLIILLGLILLDVFRWQPVAFKETNFEIIKWKVDRWTGQRWADVSGNLGAADNDQKVWSTMLPSGPFIGKTKEQVIHQYWQLTAIWRVLTGSFLIITLYCAMRIIFKKPKLEEEKG